MNALPILYSFRRCPYAMRARMALSVAGIAVELREVKLAAKPPELFAASPKATVPVLALPDGTVIDESLAIMRWALAHNDPEGWLAGDDSELIAQVDGSFKHYLDRYKYPNRYEPDGIDHRAQGLAILRGWDERLAQSGQMCGARPTLADVAVFPFIRQFAGHDRGWFEGQDLPHLHLWLAGHLASSLFAHIMTKLTPWEAGAPGVILDPQTHATPS